MRINRLRLITLMSLALCFTASTEPMVEHERQTGSPGATVDEINEIAASELAAAIKLPTVLGFGNDQLIDWSKDARGAHSSASTTKGQRQQKYDVVIQLGHYPRKKGKTGGQGKYVSEQEAAAWVGTMLAERLKRTGYNTIIIPADEYARPLSTKIFLALHTDSAALKCSVGPSVGYGEAHHAKGMHGIALALALTLGLDAKKFMRDNYTKNLSGYYAYKDIEASEFEGVLEMAELSCPKDEQTLLSRAESLSTNLHTAIEFALR